MGRGVLLRGRGRRRVDAGDAADDCDGLPVEGGDRDVPHKRVIVKQLGAIQNLGAMDVLCTDKTGTLTRDHIILEKHCDVVLESDNTVLELAYLNSHFQTGLKNLLDRAILEARMRSSRDVPLEKYAKVDEIPFDFVRKIMSVVVKTPDGTNH